MYLIIQCSPETWKQICSLFSRELGLRIKWSYFGDRDYCLEGLTLEEVKTLQSLFPNVRMF